MRVRHKLIRKQYYDAMNEDDIPCPPHFDTSIDGPFTKHDNFRSIAERLYSWAVCDANKQHELNPLRHSSERVLGYWNKHDPEQKMSTNPLFDQSKRSLAQRSRRLGFTRGESTLSSGREGLESA